METNREARTKKDSHTENHIQEDSLKHSVRMESKKSN